MFFVNVYFIHLKYKNKTIIIMETIATQNGISITANTKRTTFMVVAKMELGTSDVIYGCVSTERKALNLFKKVLNQSGIN
jgi:hypothetical protein